MPSNWVNVLPGKEISSKTYAGRGLRPESAEAYREGKPDFAERVERIAAGFVAASAAPSRRLYHGTGI